MKSRVSILKYDGIAIGSLILKDEIDTCNFKNTKYNLSIY